MTSDFRNAEEDSRYSRQELIAGWRQSRLREARVLVAGAGALGNEVLKNLVLSGVGQLAVVDFDRVERSNLSRCVLFREGELGLPKAAVAARRLEELNGAVAVEGWVLDLRYGLGAGALRGFDAVLGCLDNLEARLALNRLCRAAGVPWLDGGMDARGGQVSFFHPRLGPCFECGMTAAMWLRVAERQSCLGLGGGAVAQAAPMAATVTMASLLGAFAAQECVRLLQQGAPSLQPGERLCLQSAPYALLTLRAQARPDCAAHALAADEPPRIEADPTAITAAELLRQTGAERLRLDWDVAYTLECHGCEVLPAEPVSLPLFRLDRQRLTCPGCGRPRVPALQSVVEAGTALADATLAELGVPPRAILMLERGSGDARQAFAVELGVGTRQEARR